jgi:hypothetical protein
MNMPAAAGRDPGIDRSSWPVPAPGGIRVERTDYALQWLS